MGSIASSERASPTPRGCPDGGLDSDVQNCGACGTVCPSAIHASTVCRGGSCGRGACAAGFFDVDGTLTPGCESTCSGASCTLPDGGAVMLTQAPAPESGGFIGVVSSGSNLGTTTQTNGLYRHVGAMGESPGTGGQRASNGVFQNVGGLTGLGR